MKSQRRRNHAGPGRSQAYTYPPGTDADENCSSKRGTRSGQPIRYRRRKHQSQVRCSKELQIPVPSTVSTNHTTDGASLVVDIGSSQPSQCVKLLQSVSLNHCGSEEAIAQEKPDRCKVVETEYDRHVTHSDRKVSPPCIECESQFLDFKNQQDVEIANLKLQDDSLSNLVIVLHKEKKSLQELCEKQSADFKVLQDEKKSLQEFCEKQATEFKCRILDITNTARERVRFAKKHIHEQYSAGIIDKNIRQRDEVVSKGKIIEVLRSDVKRLQKTLDMQERQIAIPGSYAEGSATLGLLPNAFFEAKVAITRLQKCFAEAIESKYHPQSIAHLFNIDASYFAKTQHVKYAVRSILCERFFEGFENESLNTLCGISKFVDPDVRQAKFFEYYIREREGNYADVIEDPQYHDFYRMKLFSVWEKINLTCKPGKKDMQMTCLEELGGPKLASSFRAAARAVWLLHKLAFAFEPPANIFRVEPGADVHPVYMESVESLEDSDKFVHKVGLMVAPGLRHRKSVLRCEIYVSCVSTGTAD